MKNFRQIYIKKYQKKSADLGFEEQITELKLYFSQSAWFLLAIGV
jgi:hypothetical protein